MGRQKLYSSNAERQRAYRIRSESSQADLERLLAWKQQSGFKQAYNKQSTRERRKRIKMTIPFISFDGEGTSSTEQVASRQGMPVFRHLYTLLASSSGRYVENYSGLSTEQCLEFILGHFGTGIGVSFGFSYDVTMILKDLSVIELKSLWTKGELYWREYWIRWIPGKSFQVGAVINGKITKTFLIYDVFAFFQKSFVSSLQDWHIDVPIEVIEGKQNRASFVHEQRETIRKYNALECKMLVELMDKLRASMYRADFLPGQWYGAGAIASAMLEQHGTKFFCASPLNMIPKFLAAYYGGRNQALQLGEFPCCYLHDINSAYPSAMVDLPTSLGEWYQCNPAFFDYPYTLYKIKWNLPATATITPFPVRSKGRIYWPLEGSGYYWYPEIAEAMKHYAKNIIIEECWAFKPVDETLPFIFLQEYYERRKAFVEEHNDAEKCLKLGINACYGKVAQSIGKGDKAPPYQNFFWAGYTTSITRARVFALAMTNPRAIVAFATDGVCATQQLAPIASEKTLGGWDVQQVTDYFLVQSGVYCYTAEDAVKHKSRGFSYRSINYDVLRELWREYGVLAALQYTEKRFIGIGSGLRTNSNEIGTWQEQQRELRFFPVSMDVPPHTTPNAQIRLANKKTVGDSEAYKMKVDWRQSEADFDRVEEEENL